jgi:hypothetical protein
VSTTDQLALLICLRDHAAPDKRQRPGLDDTSAREDGNPSENALQAEEKADSGVLDAFWEEYHGGNAQGLPQDLPPGYGRKMRVEAKVGYGVTANIAASHAAARGSTPRIRVRFATCVSPFEHDFA